jgi:hypothetical protein
MDFGFIGFGRVGFINGCSGAALAPLGTENQRSWSRLRSFNSQEGAGSFAGDDGHFVDHPNRLMSAF